MSKKQCGTSLEQALYERVSRVATVDRRSIAEVIAAAVAAGLPLLEEELSRPKLNLSDYLLNDSPRAAAPAATLRTAKK